MNKFVTSLLLIASSLAVSAASSILTLKNSITDNSIIYPESFETDTHKMMQNWYLKNYAVLNDSYAKTPVVNATDEEYIKRLSSMPTEIEMPYNQVVRSYINMYVQRRRDLVESMLGMSLYYMPIFEQALERKGLPLELRYLPVIESALNPDAVSRAGATGLWQFMLPTARGLGLEINTLVDERRDPYASSEAAATYLKQLYDMYNDWSLAIAAYNCGPGTVNKALRRAGGDPKSHDFWGIYYYLPAETRGYVPMFIAANYVMSHHADHNISAVLPVKPLVTDTIHITDRVHFNQISSVLNIPIEELRILNPQFRADIIPGTPDTPYTLILPSQQIHAYLMSEDEIKGFESDKYQRRDVVEPGEVPGDAMLAVEDDAFDVQTQEDEVGMVAAGGKSSVIVHKVAAGETLASIAEKYDVTAAEIRKNNNLRRNAVRVGQQLKITTTATTDLAVLGTHRAPMTDTSSDNGDQDYVTAQRPARRNTATKTSPRQKQKQQQTTTHKVKSGESLYVIAKKYGTTVEALRNANGVKGTSLQPGQTLKVPVKGTKYSKGSAKTKKGSAKSKKSKKSKGSKKKSSKKRRR